MKLFPGKRGKWHFRALKRPPDPSAARAFGTRGTFLTVRSEKPQTLVETLDHTRPDFYPGMCVALVTLLTYTVSTCATERSFRGMKSTITEERLSSLEI